jgi:hypothetical protein
MKISDILVEEKKDTHCSDKCCGSDTLREDCKCPPDCKGCNCNNPNISETTSAGAVAAVAAPVGGMISRQMKNPDGTAKNALDVDTNLLGGKAKNKRSKKK